MLQMWGHFILSSLIFCSLGIISPGRMHLYLALLFHRDYFARPDASLSDSFAPQGLLYPGQMHLYLALLFHRDYFARLNASLSDSFAPQGLFRPAECISVWLFCAAGIISTARMHPITGRPSLKTSLPGHSVKFKFSFSESKRKSSLFWHFCHHNGVLHTPFGCIKEVFIRIIKHKGAAVRTNSSEQWYWFCYSYLQPSFHWLFGMVLVRNRV